MTYTSKQGLLNNATGPERKLVENHRLVVASEPNRGPLAVAESVDFLLQKLLDSKRMRVLPLTNVTITWDGSTLNFSTPVTLAFSDIRDGIGESTVNITGGPYTIPAGEHSILAIKYAEGASSVEPTSATSVTAYAAGKELEELSWCAVVAQREGSALRLANGVYLRPNIPYVNGMDSHVVTPPALTTLTRAQRRDHNTVILSETELSFVVSGTDGIVTGRGRIVVPTAGGAVKSSDDWGVTLTAANPVMAVTIPPAIMDGAAPGESSTSNQLTPFATNWDAITLNTGGVNIFVLGYWDTTGPEGGMLYVKTVHGSVYKSGETFHLGRGAILSDEEIASANHRAAMFGSPVVVSNYKVDLGYDPERYVWVAHQPAQVVQPRSGGLDYGAKKRSVAPYHTTEGFHAPGLSSHYVRTTYLDARPTDAQPKYLYLDTEVAVEDTPRPRTVATIVRDHVLLFQIVVVPDESTPPPQIIPNISAQETIYVDPVWMPGLFMVISRSSDAPSLPGEPPSALMISVQMISVQETPPSMAAAWGMLCSVFSQALIRETEVLRDVFRFAEVSPQDDTGSSRWGFTDTSDPSGIQWTPAPSGLDQISQADVVFASDFNVADRTVLGDVTVDAPAGVVRSEALISRRSVLASPSLMGALDSPLRAQYLSSVQLAQGMLLGDSEVLRANGYLYESDSVARVYLNLQDFIAVADEASAPDWRDFYTVGSGQPPEDKLDQLFEDGHCVEISDLGRAAFPGYHPLGEHGPLEGWEDTTYGFIYAAMALMPVSGTSNRAYVEFRLHRERRETTLRPWAAKTPSRTPGSNSPPEPMGRDSAYFSAYGQTGIPCSIHMEIGSLATEGWALVTVRDYPFHL